MAKTIVAIDDDEKVLELVSGILQKDYNIKPFSIPEEAVSTLKQGLNPDLIICDVMMPNMTGFEVHKAVRSIPNLVSIPFLYLTALDDKSYFRKGMLLGADDYITKPFLSKDLREAVNIRFLRAAEIKRDNADVDKALNVQSLGGFKVLYGRERIKWSVKKAAAAFLYLLHNNKSMPIDQMKKDLWREPVIDNTLHVLNLRLRKVISSFAKLEVNQGIVSLKLLCPYKWDIEEFQAAAQKALEASDFREVEGTLQVYKGEFLPNFDLPWAETQRVRYEEVYLQLLALSIEIAPDGTNKRVAKERLERFING